LRPFKIPTAGMEPTLMGNETARDGRILKEGDHVLAERFAYLFHKPRRGDIAIFKTVAINVEQRDKFRVPSDQLYMKRIVGLPGERISIKAKTIFINGQKLIEPKVFETLMARTNPVMDLRVQVPEQQEEIALGPDEYYVLGDNLWNSLDSRYYGPIQGGHFGGKIFLIFLPAKRRGFVQ
jgi:signal peptidase I